MPPNLPASSTPSAPALVSLTPLLGLSGQAPWTTEFLRLVRHRFWLKFLGISGFMWLFFTAYFHVLRHPVRPALAMPLTPLDDWIGFQPWAFWAYVSLWVYVGIPAGLMPNLRALLRYGGWALLLCGVGLACFYAFPTAVPPAGRAIGSAAHAGFAVLQGVDAPGNACPSLHVATALFTAAWVHRLLGELRAAPWARLLNATWALLIVYSTVAIKQHVVLDVLGGTVLAAVMAVVSLRFSTGGSTGAGR